MNKLLQELLEYTDEIYNSLCEKEEDTLKTQMRKALRILRDWKFKMREESPHLFWYAINVKIPYWEHWVRKYKTITPSMAKYLLTRWEEYTILKNKNDTNGMDSFS